MMLQIEENSLFTVFNWDSHTAGKAEIHMHGERKDIVYRV